MGRIYNYQGEKIRKIVAGFRSSSSARRICRVSYQFYDCWRTKHLDSNFHPNKHGGIRWQKYGTSDHNLIRFWIWKKVQKDPLIR